MVNIAFGFNDKFVMPSSVCFHSLLGTKKQTSFYNIIVYYHDLSLKNRNTLQQDLSGYQNFTLTFIEVSALTTNHYFHESLSLDIFNRLKLHRILDEQYTKVIYSDVDVIFMHDLTDIYNTDLKNNCIGAEIDLIHTQNIKDNTLSKRNFNGKFNVKTYHYSGFLLLDLIKMRQLNLDADLNKLIAMDCFRCPDQDIMNILYQNNIMTLNKKLVIAPNTIKRKADLKGTNIIHYFGPTKPWTRPNKLNYIPLTIWRQYYKKSIFNTNGKFPHKIPGIQKKLKFIIKRMFHL